MEREKDRERERERERESFEKEKERMRESPSGSQCSTSALHIWSHTPRVVMHVERVRKRDRERVR